MWNLENSEQGSHSEAATLRAGVLEIFMDKSAWNRISKNNGQSSGPALGKVEACGGGTRGLEAGLLQPEGCRVGEWWGVAVFCAARTSLPCRTVKMSQSRA